MDLKITHGNPCCNWDYPNSELYNKIDYLDNKVRRMKELKFLLDRINYVQWEISHMEAVQHSALRRYMRSKEEITKLQSNLRFLQTQLEELKKGLRNEHKTTNHGEGSD